MIQTMTTDTVKKIFMFCCGFQKTNDDEIYHNNDERHMQQVTQTLTWSSERVL